jgi:hypothetical protein
MKLQEAPLNPQIPFETIEVTFFVGDSGIETVEPINS